jgi:hypothetical protein
MAKMAKEGCSHAAIEETKYLFMKLHAEAREAKKQHVALPGHEMVMTVIQWHMAMLLQHPTSGSLPCHNGTTNNPETRW